eukprot:TRINITY_DN7081_c0_g1_i1.p1 TRINITY_DN7081_c0_g1~~TRINITY_DN7081_c0_g1_i1.p1  ORF type:complete len:739 (-),score=113.60 TRINITY_DN7081_c0_g1_i1:722-2938(-)
MSMRVIPLEDVEGSQSFSVVPAPAKAPSPPSKALSSAPPQHFKVTVDDSLVEPNRNDSPKTLQAAKKRQSTEPVSTESNAALRSTTNLSKGGLNSTQADVLHQEDIQRCMCWGAFYCNPKLELAFWEDYQSRYKKHIFFGVRVMPIFCIAYLGSFVIMYHEIIKYKENWNTFFVISSVILGFITVIAASVAFFRMKMKTAVILLNFSLALLFTVMIAVQATNQHHFVTKSIIREKLVFERADGCPIYNAENLCKLAPSTSHIKGDPATENNCCMIQFSEDGLYELTKEFETISHSQDSYAFSLISVVFVFSIMNPILKLPFRHVFYQAIYVTIINVCLTYAMENYSNTRRAALFSILLCIVVTTFCYSARRAEAVLRTNYLHERDLIRKQERLMHKLKRIQKVKKLAVDLDAPIEKALEIVQGLKSSADITNQAANDLELLLQILSNPNLFNPDFKKQVKDSEKDLDGEVKSWIMYEFAHIMPLSATTRSISATSLPELGRGFDTYSKVPRTQQVEKAEAILNGVLWNADVFGLHEMTAGHGLTFTLNHLLRKHNLLTTFKISETKLGNLLHELEAGYQDNPFHNQIHAADVTMNVHYLIHRPNFAESFTDIDKLACLLAAAVHDFRHPGVNNPYHIAMEKDLAVFYNDHSVLENYHISQFFQLVNSPDKDCNILSGMSRAERKELRETMIEMVLATDMSNHFMHLNQFKSSVQAGKFDFLSLISVCLTKFAIVSPFP